MIDKFEEEREITIAKLGAQEGLKKQAIDFISKSAEFNYSYHFDWMGSHSHWHFRNWHKYQ